MLVLHVCGSLLLFASLCFLLFAFVGTNMMQVYYLDEYLLLLH